MFGGVLGFHPLVAFQLRLDVPRPRLAVETNYGSRFRRYTWENDRRHGLLGHASLLTVTSYANRTSVVLRGKWVLENLLGAPPPNVPPLEEQNQHAPTSLRERMDQHRANPVCAACHTRMDRLGFAMEHFDAIGCWRETADTGDSQQR